ncbi:ADP-ribosyltransferase [uncultured Methanobrevibacter sp.]|uniref:ADP-ribosyltransferase n=1 Tax=uncultured Methanobrevibacter sp. TaxID=253161 RepID=UPI0025F9C94A|nr:ADP-ribosyltransferase [uncultured Methanobrevibacter sp.]
MKYSKHYYDKVFDKTTGQLINGNAKVLAESIAHDVPVLDDILNNQLKEGMTLWRVQEKHNLGDAVVGDIIDFPNFRSTAVSKNGALWFSKTNAKEMNYLIEIEAPAGTKGAYLAPIKKGEITNPDSPGFGEKYANEMEFLLKKCKVELVKFEDTTVKGANGEKLKHVLLRIVGW